MRVLFLLAGVLGLAVGIGWADEVPAGLVMDVAGVEEAQIAPYTELMTGRTVELGPEGTMTLFHYSTCSYYSVTSGAVQFSDSGAEPSDGASVTERPGRCPTAVVSGQGKAGVVIVRTVSKLPRLSISASPEFGLIGSVPHRILLRAPDGETVLLKMDARWAGLAADATPLEQGTYRVVFEQADGGEQVIAEATVLATIPAGKVTLLTTK